MKARSFQFNAGTGMAMGAVLAAVIALVVQLSTGDKTIWMWAIPIGVAIGFAIGAGSARKAQPPGERHTHT